MALHYGAQREHQMHRIAAPSERHRTPCPCRLCSSTDEMAPKRMDSVSMPYFIGGKI